MKGVLENVYERSGRPCYDTVYHPFHIVKSCAENFANFQIALDNLVQIGYVKILPNGFDEKMPIYDLTQKGIEANGFFEKSIPVYIRDQICEHIVPFFEAESLKKSVKAVLAPINDREYNVECAIYDSASPLLELTFYAGEREMAAKIIRNFKANPEKAYEKITQALLGDEE